MNLPKNPDVLIVGGGIIGLSLARRLRQQGVEKIVILEKNSACGMEASSAAAGMLAPQAEADRADLFFNFCRESRDLYPQFAAELISETGVDIELDRTGTLYLAFNETDAAELEKRYAWQTRSDLPVEKLTAKEILEIEPNISPNVLFGLRFPLDWQVENRKIIEALKLQFNETNPTQNSNHQHVFQETVKSLIFENNKVIGVETNAGNIFASQVVIASGAWTSLIKDKFDLLSSLNVAPVRGQVIAFNGADKLFRHVIYTPRGYIVPRRNGRVLVGATVEDAGFENITTDAGKSALLSTASEISRSFEKMHPTDLWSGLRPFVADSLPVLGEFTEIENLLIATAHYRNGILLAPKTSEILADKITRGSASEHLEAFNPRRFAAAQKV
jgi:glycine oxidase